MADEKAPVELSSEAREAVRSYMLKIFGVAAPVVAIIAGVAGYLIKDVAASNAVNVALQEIQRPLIDATQQVSQALASAAALEGKADGLETQIDTLDRQIAAFENAAQPEKIVARVSAEIVTSHKSDLIQPLETSLVSMLNTKNQTLLPRTEAEDQFVKISKLDELASNALSEGLSTIPTKEKVLGDLKSALLDDPNAVAKLRPDVGDVGRYLVKNHTDDLRGSDGSDGQNGKDGRSGIDGKDGKDGDAAFVPAGAVIAFDRPSGCPSGWTDMGQDWRGKMLVAAARDTNNRYGFRRSGGAETHKLTPAEMPSHSHIQVWGQGTSGPIVGNNIARFNSAAKIQRTVAEGGGRAHNNMPPYIALYFCKKDSG